ncbi:hypothetical protein [Meiothermus sp. Pnk-1]|uniref:hypothetical protein n=1 Tax=Meiothermus sp. Pnk-1 TaxID=873128 RepID=UPI0011B3CE44|nr:hypothetical protein [Meiothermus sp. Pnk-1]
MYSDTAGVAGTITGQGTLGGAPAYEVTTASGDKRVIPADQAIPYGQGPDTRELSPEEARLIESGRLRVGDTKTVFGVTYRLNENHRWERVDEEAPLDPEAAYRQQVFQAAQRALEAGKKLGVRTHLRYWPLDRPEQLAFRNGQLYLIDRGQAVAIAGLTLDDLAGQVGVSRPKRDEGPDPAIEAERQRQAEAQADKRWRDFVDKRFGGDQEAALAAYEENNRQRVMADQSPLSLDEFVQQAAAPSPGPAESPWERLGATRQDGFIVLKDGREVTYNHRKRIEVGSVYPSGAPDSFSPAIKLRVEGEPKFENGKKSPPKASDLAWRVVCVFPSGQELTVSAALPRKDALGKAERLLENPKLLVGKLEPVLAKDFPKDHQALADAGMFAPPAPATPPAPEPAPPANGGEYRDVGEKIGGARKDLAALQARAKEEGFRLSLTDLETLEQDPAIARRLLTRDNLVGKPLEFAAELRANSSAGVGFMATKILSRVESSPADTPQARRAFALGLHRLGEALRGAKDVQGLKGAMRELAAEYNGFYKAGSAPQCAPFV